MDSAALLFGHDSLERVVAIEQAGAEVVLYLRNTDGSLSTVRREFHPWLYAGEPFPLEGATWKKLDDPSANWLFMLARFDDWHSHVRARRELREVGAEFLAPGSPQRQFLTASGITLFKGLNFGEIHCLQLDLETTGLNPYLGDAKVLMVAICDNGGYEKCISGDERAVIEEAISVIRDRDPDVIEGHNILEFDLPYLSARAAALGIPLAIGRDGSPVNKGQRRNVAVGGMTKTRATFWIHGRHIVDTMTAVQRFDAAKGEMSSYGLKAVAEALGIAEPDRIILDRSKMAELVDCDPDTVSEYALQDVRETRALAELLCATEFYQTQMVPEGYQNVTVMGMGDKINALMQRAYLRAEHPIPMAQAGRVVPGGYTEVRRVGVLKPVVKADAQSLYPSIMERFQIAPASDKLGVFLPMLCELTERRIEAKGKMARAEGMERTYWDGLQGSFKILINSFYGYLGAPLHFNDPEAAAAVTTTGQEIVKQAAEQIEQRGGQVIEVDTDGIYFVPPSEIRSEQEFIDEVGKTLPSGIHLVHDGTYAAMLSLKVKNYVLQREDGSLIFHGASMRSRADERFGREFIEQAVKLLLDGRPEELTSLYVQAARAIDRGEVAPYKLSRRERVTTRTFESKQKKRARAAVEEAGASIGDYLRVYQSKTGALRPLDNYADDEDREFYVEKLYKFACRLEAALGEDFRRLIPRPGSPLLGLGDQGSLFDAL